MLKIQVIKKNSKELIKIEQLYQRAFPANERRPLAPLVNSMSEDSVIGFYDNELFCGFACMLTDGDITHILYLAIDTALRGKGYGSSVLKAIRELKKNNRIVVDIEAEQKDAMNNEQRKKRKSFYLRNGYIETTVKYSWRNESYELLVQGGSLSKQEFADFWENIYTKNDALLGY